MQMGKVIANDGGVYVLGTAGFTQRGSGSGAPEAHTPGLRVVEISKPWSMSAGFHQKMAEVNRVRATGSSRRQM
nr:hypothetical protein [Streptomyces sp. Ag109_O5-10]